MVTMVFRSFTRKIGKNRNMTMQPGPPGNDAAPLAQDVIHKRKWVNEEIAHATVEINQCV